MRQPRDEFPEIPTHGRRSVRNDNEIEKCMKPYEFIELAETPDRSKKFRTTSIAPVGKAGKHYGVAEDQNYPPSGDGVVFGRKSKRGTNAADVMNPPKLSNAEAFLLEKREQVYHSVRTEPLAKPVPRNYQMPLETKNPNFRFGATQEKSESSKNVLYPIDSQIQETSETKQLYIKSHNDYDAGEQKKLNYNWEKTRINNPTEFRFGKVTNKSAQGAKQSLFPTDTVGEKVVSKIYDEHAKSKYSEVGMPRFTDVPIKEGQTFGKKNKLDEYNAAETLRGNYSPEDLLPDKDLGKSITPGWRNISHNQNRIFGCPTVRSDIRPPKQISVADLRNYGNDPDVYCTIYPSKYIEVGLTEEDFDQLLSKEEIKDLMFKAGVVEDEKLFEEAYQFALDQFKDELEVVKKRDFSTIENGMTVQVFRKSFNYFQFAS